MLWKERIIDCAEKRHEKRLCSHIRVRPVLLDLNKAQSDVQNI